MSLSWRERLVIGLGPDGVEFARFPASWRRSPPERGEIRAAEQGPEPWRGALVALPRLASRKSSCEVVLSSHFTRCQVLPWHANLANRKEYAALARAHFRAVYGSAADVWDIRLSHAGYGKPTLACAVDGALLSELGALLGGAGARVESISPHFASAFNRWRRACNDASFWFALVEPGRLWLGRAAGGAWTGVASRFLGRDAVAETLTALEQERATAADTAGPVRAVVNGLGREEVHALREAGLNILGSVARQRFDLGASAA